MDFGKPRDASPAGHDGLEVVFFKLRDEHKVPDMPVARDSFGGPSHSEVCRSSAWSREVEPDRSGHHSVLFMFVAQLEEEEFR